MGACQLPGTADALAGFDSPVVACTQPASELHARVMDERPGERTEQGGGSACVVCTGPGAALSTNRADYTRGGNARAGRRPESLSLLLSCPFRPITTSFFFFFNLFKVTPSGVGDTLGQCRPSWMPGPCTLQLPCRWSVRIGGQEVDSQDPVLEGRQEAPGVS